MPASLSPTAYAHSYGLVPIVNSQGRIRRARSPNAAQWWCTATEWIRLRRAMRSSADRDDVLGTAQRLGVAIATHDVVMARSAAAAALLDQALQRAEAAGLLGFFNREYRRRRREAAAARKSFVSYGNARRRLQHAVAKAIADGGAIAPSMIVQVFESG